MGELSTNLNLYKNPQERKEESFFYNVARLLSQRCLFNFVIGNRGGGKTYGGKKLVIKRFLNKGHKFVWIRRYQTEIDTLSDFWGAVKNDPELLKKFPDLELTQSGNDLYINGEHAGTLIALSTSMQLKSVDFAEVKTIIFDEFSIDKGRIVYLKNEVQVFLELYETIARMREGVVAIFFGNGISIVNPYFTYFKIAPKLGQRFTKKGDICVEFYFNDKFVEQKENTRFGRIIKNTDYGEYNMRNKFLRDTDSFIVKRPNTANEKMYQFIFDGEKFSLWRDYKYQRFYIDRNYEKNFGEFRTYVSNLADMIDSDKSMIMFKKNQRIAKRLTELIEHGDLFFCDQGAKQKFYEILLNY